MGSSSDAQGSGLPLDANEVRALLRSMGIDDYEPRVLQQLLEFMQQYTAEIFADSSHYAEHAGRAGQLECEDVQLSVRLRAAMSQPTAPQLTEWMARARNREPLTAPTVPNVQLPNPKLCLVEENWQLAPTRSSTQADDDAISITRFTSDASHRTAASEPSDVIQPKAPRSKQKIAINISGAGRAEPMAVDQ
jgi:transcription initiation factor TFIID subunit 9B